MKELPLWYLYTPSVSLLCFALFLGSIVCMGIFKKRGLWVSEWWFFTFLTLTYLYCLLYILAKPAIPISPWVSAPLGAYLLLYAFYPKGYFLIGTVTDPPDNIKNFKLIGISYIKTKHLTKERPVAIFTKRTAITLTLCTFFFIASALFIHLILTGVISKDPSFNFPAFKLPGR